MWADWRTKQSDPEGLVDMLTGSCIKVGGFQVSLVVYFNTDTDEVISYDSLGDGTILVTEDGQGVHAIKLYGKIEIAMDGIQFYP